MIDDEYKAALLHPKKNKNKESVTEWSTATPYGNLIPSCKENKHCNITMLIIIIIADLFIIGVLWYEGYVN